MTVHMTNREICLKAAQRLREVGWRQGTFGGKDGPHCMLGACMWVTGSPGVNRPLTAVTAVTAADVAYSAYAHTPPSGPFGFDLQLALDWNDEPGRTVEEVIAVLEACPP